MPCSLAITSVSLGRCFSGHSLSDRLDMAHSYGYRGIELFYEEIDYIAKRLPGVHPRANELEAARIIGNLCRERQLAILCLQPFWNYEGLLDRQEHAKRVEQLAFWFLLAQTLGTDMVQIPSNFLPTSRLSEDTALAVEDLQEVADMGLREQPPIRFAYEALCWGTRCDIWEHSWDIVKAVGRPNFGLCLDTFNIAGRIFGDPTARTARAPNYDEAIRESLGRLVATVDVHKVFCVQVADAEPPSGPLVKGHEFYIADQPPRMSWSRNYRLFYGEKDRGAYLPITQISQAIFQGLGFEGWVSMELFNRRMLDRDGKVPRELAIRGITAWGKLVSDMNLTI